MAKEIIEVDQTSLEPGDIIDFNDHQLNDVGVVREVDRGGQSTSVSVYWEGIGLEEPAYDEDTMTAYRITEVEEESE